MKGKKGNNPKSVNSELRTPNSGILYVVSTPIGNLEDITLRALRVLKAVDLIAAESVTHSRRLCRHYGIETRLVRYNQHNQSKRGPELIRGLKSGLDVALVTNAGTPGVSDPGALLVRQASEQGIRVSPVPGPSAMVAALSVSGFRTDKFLFLGFLSHRAGKRKRELKGLVAERRTMVFFEAPHRLQETLAQIREILGDRQVVLLRELTKIYEEVVRGSVSHVMEQLEPERMKGEFTLVVAGTGAEVGADLVDEETVQEMERLLKQGHMSVKDIATRLSEQKGLPYRWLYKECLSIKRALGPSGEVRQSA